MPEHHLASGETILFVTHRHVITLVVPVHFVLLSGALLLFPAWPVAVELRLDDRCPLVGAIAMVAAVLPLRLGWITNRFFLINPCLLQWKASLWRLTRSLKLSAVDRLSLRP